MINTGKEQTGGGGGGNYGPKAGLFKARVVAINPSQEQIEQLYGRGINWTPDYVGKTNENEQKVNMDIWLQDIVDNNYYRLKFSIIEKVKESASNPGNYQWLNTAGQTIYAASHEDIASRTGKQYEFFRQRPYRYAMVGEENLFEFLSMWVTQGKKASDEMELDPDMKLLFKGDFSELQKMVPLMAARQDEGIITALATISTSKTDATKKYQNVWKRVGAGWWLEKIVAGDDQGAIGYWVKDVTGTYGCKDEYSLTPIHGNRPAPQAQKPTPPTQSSGPAPYGQKTAPPPIPGAEAYKAYSNTDEKSDILPF